MKKKALILLPLIVLLTVVVFADNISQLLAYIVPYKVIVNGEEKKFDSPVVTINDRTYIPLREAGETLGMDVEWSEETKTVTMNTKKQQESKLYPFKKEQLYGFMDATGNIVIEPQYTNAREFSEGLAFVTIGDGTCGYIDKSGTLVITDSFLVVNPFHQGLAAVVKRHYTKEDRPNITDVPGPYVYIDKTGKEAFNTEFSNADDFSDSFASVFTKDGIDCYIDLKGNLIQTEYDIVNATPFIDGFASVRLENGKYAIIDKNFKMLFSGEYNDFKITNGGYAVARKGAKFGVLDVKGNVVIDFQYDYLSGYEDQLFIFRKGDRQGYIDINNNLVLSGYSFSKLDKFENGFAIAAEKGANYGVINKSGEFVIPPEFKQIYSFGEGLYRCVTLEDTETFYNTSGEEIIPH